MTSVALSVQKAEGAVASGDVSRDYNGQPVETPAITSLGTGALTVEYRAQGGEFTTQAPKAVGSYTVRVTAAADDDYASASAQRNFRITARVSPSTASPWSPPRPMTAPPTPPS